MNIHARYGFPLLAAVLAGVVVLGGCKTQWDRWNDHYLGPDYDADEYADGVRAFSLMRPGQTRIEDAKKLLGPSLKPRQLDGPQSDAYVRFDWGPGCKKWDIRFSNDGVLMSCNRWLIGNLAWGLDPSESDELDRWYVCNLRMNPVPPEQAAGLVPGVTTQELVFAAWGPPIRADIAEAGGFFQCWGSYSDNWTLQFDAAGVLTAAPQHYVSSN